MIYRLRTTGPGLPAQHSPSKSTDRAPRTPRTSRTPRPGAVFAFSGKGGRLMRYVIQPRRHGHAERTSDVRGLRPDAFRNAGRQAPLHRTRVMDAGFRARPRAQPPTSEDEDATVRRTQRQHTRRVRNPINAQGCRASRACECDAQTLRACDTHGTRVRIGRRDACAQRIRSGVRALKSSRTFAQFDLCDAKNTTRSRTSR